jgi:drug/metabolite transporter (DMT)-like permease
MAALLALTAAVAYGAGDFLGGVAARREPATAVVLWSHIVGLLALVATAPLIGGDVTAPAMLIGALAGLAGAVGMAAFYKALSLGAMSVVAPVTGLLSAAIPVLAGVARGERPEPVALVGIAVALIAIVLVSREAAGDAGESSAGAGGGDPVAEAAPRRVGALALALVAGVAFGLFFVTIDGAGEGAGIWPLVAARIASVALFGTLALAGITAAAVPRTAGAAALGCGLLDASANVLYVLALAHGLLSIVSVLTALYPAGTVLLARYLLGEQITRVQQAGLAFAGCAALLIAA